MVSWLPLYHDMGLVGFLAIPMTRACRSSRPRRRTSWPTRATGCSGSRDWRRHGHGRAELRLGAGDAGAASGCEGLDLSSLTLALSGAEPVDPDAVEAFVAAAEPFGFPPGGVFPAFGMAEVAIGGSFPPRGRGLVCDTVDRVVLERDRVAKPVDVADPDELAARRAPAARARPGRCRGWR